MVMLDRKLLRDLVAWRGQIFAIVMIVACGVATYVAMQSVYESLSYTKAVYYDTYRFSHVFTSLTRAPDAVATRIAAIPGIAAVQPRVVADVTVDLPGREDAVTARLISIPETRRPALNDLYLRSGRYVSENARDEALVSEAFADANGLAVGQKISAVINRRHQVFRIVGIALSPEYIYEIRGATDIWPDNRHFGIMWIGRKTLAGAFDLTGAFNDLAISLAPDAQEEGVIESVDRILAPFGGLGAVPARDQASNRFISDELTQLRVQSIFIPLIFLGIAAFLLNVALSRLIATQREQIAILKALGVSNLAVAAHYGKLVAAIMGIGALLGTLLGAWLGWRMTIIYIHFFHFPFLSYHLSAGVVAAAVAIAGAAAFSGALISVRRAVTQAPAEAMRPASPPPFSATLLERAGLMAWLAPASRMVLRNIERKPLTALGTMLAVAFAIAILIVGRFGMDAVNYMIDLQFRQIEREDVTLSFVRPLDARARFELASLPGVRQVETFRAVVVRFSHEHRSRRVALLGLPRFSPLHRIVDERSRVYEVPPGGVLLSAKLAEVLGVRAGDRLDMHILEGRRAYANVYVAGTIDDVVGLNAYMRDEQLWRILGEDAVSSGAYLTLDSALTTAFDQRIKGTPAVAAVAYRAAMMAEFQKTIAESMAISIGFLIGFAAAIACGVIYNAGRIAISERGRELSTLRVLGYSRGEVATMLLGEQGLITLVSLPLGALIGYALCWFLLPLYETEVFRMSLIAQPSTYVIAILTVVGLALLTSVLIRRELDRLDLLAVLKASE